MTTVLVTGGSGGLGKFLLERLRASYRTRALEHRTPVEADEVVSGDIVTGRGLDEAVAGADAVIHLAALTHSRRAAAYATVNLEGTRRLLKAAERAGVARFVHVSTRAIDPSGGAYSASKARAEELVRAASTDWVIVRLSEVYGAGSREGVDAIAASARVGRPVLVVGDGEQEVCPLHVEDAVDAIAGALRAPIGRTYTIGGECTTVRAFADACVSAFGSHSRIVRVPVPLVSLAARVSALLPLPLVPDQLLRLRAPKPRPSAEAASELMVRARPLAEGLRAFR
jgi:nucleoside-diphosphate-sugar epimerase